MAAEMAGGFNEHFLDTLQRKFGPEPTKRVKVHDEMAAFNLGSTKGCPCDDCRFRTVCLDYCDKCKPWVLYGTYRPPPRRTRAKETQP